MYIMFCGEGVNERRITWWRLQTIAYSLTCDRGSCILLQFRVTVKNAVEETYVPKTEKRGWTCGQLVGDCTFNTNQCWRVWWNLQHARARWEISTLCYSKFKEGVKTIMSKWLWGGKGVRIGKRIKLLRQGSTACFWT